MEVRPGYKQTEVGVIPEDWETKAIANLVETGAPICYGVVQVGPNTHGGVPIVAIKFVKEIARAPLHRTSSTLERPYARSRVLEGDVLISIKGTIGRVGIVPKGFNGNISRELARLRLNKKYSSEYIAHQLEASSTQERITSAVVGTTRLEFSIATLRLFELPIPRKLTEQEAIAEALNDADGLIESLEQLLAKKRHLKQGAMQKLLTGKKRLPGFSEEWQDLFVEDVIARSFCGPSPTCEERNIVGDSEWGVLKTTAITWKSWDWKKHKTLPRSFWKQPDLEIKAGDVIVTKAGPRHRVGVTAWVDYAPKRIIVSGKMICLRPNPEKAAPLMLASAIAAREAQIFLNQRTTGMAESQVNFENTALLRTPIRMPRIEEQTAIATILSDMDAEIAAIEAKLVKARSLKQGMMQELLTGRIRLIKPNPEKSRETC